MNQSSETQGAEQFTLVAGLVGLAIIALFVISNFVLGDVDPPKTDADAREIADFFSQAKIEWAAGMRYIIFFLFPIFAFGLARYVRREDELAGVLAGIALLATAWLVATGTVANTMESIMLYEGERLANEPEFARVLNTGMNAFFNAAILPHALLISCLSLAGWRTKTLPAWLSAIGGFQLVTGLIGGAALARGLDWDTFTDLTFGLSFFAFAVWYLLASVVLVVAWMRREQPRAAAGA